MSSNTLSNIGIRRSFRGIGDRNFEATPTIYTVDEIGLLQRYWEEGLIAPDPNSSAYLALKHNLHFRGSSFSLGDKLTGSVVNTVRTGLNAEYLLNEGSGQIVHDTSGNGLHGVLGAADTTESSDPAWVSDGLLFDGVDDRATLPSSADSANSVLPFRIAARYLQKRLYITGAPSTPVTVISGDHLVMSISGGPTFTCTLTAGSRTSAQIIAELIPQFLAHGIYFQDTDVYPYPGYNFVLLNLYDNVTRESTIDFVSAPAYFGTNDINRITLPVVLDCPAGSTEFWVKFIDFGGYGSPVSIIGGNSFYSYAASGPDGMWLNAGTFFMPGFFGGQVYSPHNVWYGPEILLASGTWHHIVLTADGTNKTTNAYLDGALLAANSGTLTADDVPAGRDLTQTFPVFLSGLLEGYYNGSHVWQTGDDVAQIRNLLGSDMWSDLLHGTLGEARFYTRALSDAEVLNNFNSTKARYGL